MKIAIVGDLHGNFNYTQKLLREIAKNNVDLIIQVGDFGYWPKSSTFFSYDSNDEVVRYSQWFPTESTFVDQVSLELRKLGLKLWFVDGNHENHEALAMLPVGEDGLRKLSEEVFHAPRGFRWKPAEAEWLFLGGAASIDKSFREEGFDWFPGEELSVKEIESTILQGEADVLVSHDAPDSTPKMQTVFSQFPMNSGVEVEDYNNCLKHRRKLEEVFLKCKIKRVFHGHYHTAYLNEFTIDGLDRTVVGLNCDKNDFREVVVYVDENGFLLED